MSKSNSDQIIVSVLIVSYNTQSLTLQTLDSIFISLTNPTWQQKIEIIVIDNHSTDDSQNKCQTWLNEHHFSGKVIKSTENLGFAGANNLGIADAKGEFIFLLNSDTIVQKGAIEKLVSLFGNYPIHQLTAETLSSSTTDNLGILAATLLNPDKSPQPQGGDLPSLLSLATQWLFLDELPLIGQNLPNLQHTGRSTNRQISKKEIIGGIINQDWVGGTAVMIRAAVFAEIGLLDNAIFMYGEDIEFCARARNHNWDTGIASAAKVIHLGFQSANKSAAIMGEIKGLKYFWAKHKPNREWFWAKICLQVGITIRWIMYNVRGNHEMAKTYQQALKIL